VLMLEKVVSVAEVVVVRLELELLLEFHLVALHVQGQMVRAAETLFAVVTFERLRTSVLPIVPGELV